ncbi:hypothetical protein PORY_001409 [Pneumocystis oryctolagi]|uniref:Uncharacterized protein n=1 Tax=Pneumocystis oryctolagi TaxID=42067 RepID=A0ACB7CI59_9ASCO|nr:hypothetical protein PORY_001409 [Pneumocystis oryctolagi]
MSEDIRQKANILFSEKKYEEAIGMYTEAIALDPNNHVLYSNRSACYASLKNFDEALKDSIKCIEIQPNWAKGWSRKGAALHGKGDLEESKIAYEKGLELEPENEQIKTALKAVSDSISSNFSKDYQKNDPFAHIAAKLRSPEFLSKIASNPKTSGLLSNPQFMEKLKKIQEDPKTIFHVLDDPNMASILPMLLGLDLDTPNNVNEDSKETQCSSSEELKVETEPEPLEDEESKSQRENKEEAEKEKVLGNECYKACKFEESVQHYLRAWELHKDITYLTNCSAAYYEDGKYEECIKCCEEAITYGREVLADFKLIARAFGRIGTAYMKQENYEQAIKYFNNSLTEHRTPDILKKLREAEKIKEERDRLAYIDLDKADEAREQGNKLFKDGDFAGAIKMYSEMIKRSPDDPRGYGNRAAAYIKVMSMTEALKDCEKAISLDPNFTKAYIRKASCYFAMKEYNKCIDACHSATKADENSNNKGMHAKEIEIQLQKCMSAIYAQHGRTNIATILNQARENPAALEEHMKNSQVASKIHKLINAGVVKVSKR